MIVEFHWLVVIGVSESLVATIELTFIELLKLSPRETPSRPKVKDVDLQETRYVLDFMTDICLIDLESVIAPPFNYRSKCKRERNLGTGEVNKVKSTL